MMSPGRNANVPREVNEFRISVSLSSPGLGRIKSHALRQARLLPRERSRVRAHAAVRSHKLANTFRDDADPN